MNTITCKSCANIFEQSAEVGRPRKYCKLCKPSKVLKNSNNEVKSVQIENKNSLTSTFVKIEPNIITTIEDAVNELILSFNVIKNYKQNLNGGKMRAEKGKVWTLFMARMLSQIIKKYELNYTIAIERSVQITKNLSITMDIAILNQEGKPIFHIEVKDYTDISMYKRFVLDNISLKEIYPTMHFISLSGWTASNKETRSDLNTITRIDGYVNSDSLFSDKRKSNNPLFILDHSREEIIEEYKKLMDRVSKIIIQDNKDKYVS